MFREYQGNIMLNTPKNFTSESETHDSTASYLFAANCGIDTWEEGIKQTGLFYSIDSWSTDF